MFRVRTKTRRYRREGTNAAQDEADTAPKELLPCDEEYHAIIDSVGLDRRFVQV